jgi:hypothetical protein
MATHPIKKFHYFYGSNRLIALFATKLAVGCFIIFIYGLFNEAVSNSGHAASSDRIINEL